MGASDRRAARIVGAALLTATAACPAPEPEALPEVATLVCDRDYQPTLQGLLADARATVDVAQWELFEGTATDTVVEGLGAAAARGVSVRVLLDETIEENAQAVERLVDLGVDARLDTNLDDKVHVKMVVADDLALVGSTNWSTAAIDYNSECNLLLRDAPASYLAAWYQQLWDDPERRSPPDVPAEVGLTEALVDDDLLESLLPLIDSASERVDFTLWATYLQPDNLDSPAMQVFGALADAAARGVPVRGVADWSDWNPDNNERNQEAVAWLEARGVEVRWDRPNKNLHAKTFAVDGTLQVQSANVSSSGFRYNHEAGARTREEAVVADFDTWFAELWATGTEQP